MIYEGCAHQEASKEGEKQAREAEKAKTGWGSGKDQAVSVDAEGGCWQCKGTGFTPWCQKNKSNNMRVEGRLLLGKKNK